MKKAAIGFDAYVIVEVEGEGPLTQLQAALMLDGTGHRFIQNSDYRKPPTIILDANKLGITCFNAPVAQR